MGAGRFVCAQGGGEAQWMVFAQVGPFRAVVELQACTNNNHFFWYIPKRIAGCNASKAGQAGNMDVEVDLN